MSMIDVHCHLLPGVDDGSKDWETTLEMCQMARADGVSHIVCSPHANYQYPYNRESHQQLIEELRRRVPDMEFSLGCDFHLSYENVDDAIAHPERYVIGRTNYLLIELSDFSLFNVGNTIFELQRAGMRPILTHPERYPHLQRRPEAVGEFFRQGCLVQITANSLTGSWGRTAQKVAVTLLKNSWVQMIASDAHSSTRRVPILSEARQAAAAIVGEEAATRLVETNPAAVINNEAVML
ncbi:MAG: exopolysaccharide biosynthesis protein [Acidobacteriota bacterium]|nr:exopolysaccharide biosynthesis protein [Acidobacteriota bacterium]